MLLDYLRYLAYEGDLAPFFGGEWQQYIQEPRHVSGQHLRFDPQYLKSLELDPTDPLSVLENGTGIAGHGADPFLDIPPPGYWTRPRRYSVSGSLPRVQIVIDISPEHWLKEEVSERPRYFRDYPIHLRPVGPAFGYHGGVRIRSSALARRAGTLCGVFRVRNSGAQFGLTCGHVANYRSWIVRSDGGTWWDRLLGGRLIGFGRTRFFNRPPEVPNYWQLPPGGLENSHFLDAGLFEIRRAASLDWPAVPVRPTAHLRQDEPVNIVRTGRAGPTRAKVSAITVRKSMFLDGGMRDLGDVLMLGHRTHEYVRTAVTLPGDSGAAVLDQPASWRDQPQSWCGMIVAADEAGSYASHAEHINSWAITSLGDPGIQFTADIPENA